MSTESTKVDMSSTSSSSPEQGTMETLELDSELTRLINNSKGAGGGDQKILQKTVEAVKAFLREHKDARGVGALLGNSGFVQFFVKCLKSNANNSSLQFNTAWIMEVILAYGNDAKVVAIINAGVIPMLLKLIASNDKTISGQAVATIARVATHDRSRDKLFPNISTLLGHLIKLLENKNAPEQVIKAASHILRGIILRENQVEIDNPDKRTSPIYSIYADVLQDRVVLNVADMKNLISVIVAIFNSSAEEQVKADALHCLTVLTHIYKDMSIIINSGVCSKLAFYLSHSDEQSKIAAIVAIGKIAKAGKKELLLFLKEMKETKGLREYINCFKMDLEESRQLLEGVNNLVNAVSILVSGDEKVPVSSVNAVIESGFFYCLVQCLKEKDNCPLRYYALAAQVMCHVVCALPVSKRALLVADEENLSVLKELLNSSNEIVHTHGCKIVIALVQKNTSCRDKLLDFGIIGVLLETLKKRVDLATNARALNTLACICAQNSPAPLDYYKDIPTVMKEYIHHSSVAVVDGCTNMALVVLTTIAEQGIPGTEMILYENDLLPRIIKCLEKQHKALQAQASTLLYFLSKWTHDHRKILMEAGILNYCESLLNEADSTTRASILEIMSRCLDGELTPNQRFAIRRVSPLAITEMIKRDPMTSQAAYDVFKKVSAFVLNDMGEENNEDSD